MERLTDSSLSISKRYSIFLETFGVTDAMAVAQAFDQLQWKYFPIILDFSKGRQYEKGRILPFVKKAPINHKGGTARVFQVEILEEFVSARLRSAAG